MITLIFEGSASLPSDVNTYTWSLSDVTPNNYFCGLRHMLYFLNLSKNFCSAGIWPHSCFRFYNHINHVDLYIFVHHVMKQGLHSSLVCSSCIDKTEYDGIVAIMPHFGMNLVCF